MLGADMAFSYLTVTRGLEYLGNSYPQQEQ
jgi:hypothetical protein